MKRFILPLLPAFLFALLPCARAAQFTLGPHTFTLPDGFTIEVAAPPSLVPRPIEADFDEQGRLYVTDSSGTNDKVAQQLADKPHRVLRLEDTDGDGVFDKSVVFADKLMFPEGCLWHDGSLYVSAPPSIWKFTDTNNDGVADVRVEWFKGQSLGGCANDLHGPYLGPDGWIYWCKGGFEKQTHILGNGKSFASRASHIWRARPDGTGLEPILTGGMDNPVGLTWSPEGELFLCGTFFQHPGGGKRDGIIHVIYGGVYGKENDVLEGHPRTGDLMPIMTHLGPAAPCGMARYESSVFGADYRDNLFVCNFNLHKISRHILKSSGSTFVTADSDFLVSDNTDFHPTDVFEDADGSLVVVDTGGWYKLCCPTSQLPKPDVLGAIYRIRRKDAPKVEDPRGQKLAWDKMEPEELVKQLGDSRPSVVRRAMTVVSKAGGNMIRPVSRAITTSESVQTRRNAIWALTRVENPSGRAGIDAALIDSDSVVRSVALSCVALRRDEASSTLLRATPSNAMRVTKRRVATALGRLGNKGAVPWLLQSAAPGNDRALDHALIYALIEIGDREGLASYLGANPPASSQRMALIALDQMPGGDLKAEQVTPLLGSTNALLKQTANWISSHHPEWGGALAGFLQKRLAVPNLSDSEHAELQQQLAQFIREPAVQFVVAATAHDAAAPKPNRLTAMQVMAAANFKKAKDYPAFWSKALVSSVRSHDIDLRRQAVLAARALPEPSSELSKALAEVASDGTAPADIRLNALSAGRFGALAAAGSGNFEFVRKQLDETNTVAIRSLAATLLASVRLTDDELMALTRSVKISGPLELPKLLQAYSRGVKEAVGLDLVDALKEARSFRSLRPEQVRPNLTNFPATVRAKADELLAALNTDAAKQSARLDEISLSLKSGDIRRGQAIFNSQKAACSTCHAIGYLGGNLGPDLTKIGQVRTERDLLEAVVYPSASFVRSFEPMLVVTKSGDEQSGILRRDAPDEVVLATGPNVEVRIPRAEIAEMRPGTVSVMPQGLDEQLTLRELADLLAFLKATKW